MSPPLYEAGQKPATGLKRPGFTLSANQVNGCHVLLQQLQAICTARRVFSPGVREARPLSIGFIYYIKGLSA